MVGCETVPLVLASFKACTEVLVGCKTEVLVGCKTVTLVLASFKARTDVFKLVGCKTVPQFFFSNVHTYMYLFQSLFSANC